MILRIEVEQEVDGRWLAEVIDLPGVMAYGASRLDALARVQVLALRSLADHLEHGEAIPEFLQVAFQPATQSMEIADRDMIISKLLEPPSRKDFAALVSEARQVAKQTGMTPVDVDAAVKEVRRAR
jgi:predicted RNase H-like HicB family nuclease